jgi:thioredoxin-dependent adenylylsulfate APS reductase
VTVAKNAPGGASAEALVSWALERFHPRIAIAAAGGLDGTVLIHMATRIQQNVRVVTVDTGHLPPETPAFFRRLEQRLGIAVEVIRPEPAAIDALERQHGPEPMVRSLESRLACCRARKVEPLAAALATMDAWITGLRREQSPTRATIKPVEIDIANGGLVKVNPLATWSLDDVWAYVRRHDLPYHELFDRGYSSIGCAPCTRAVAAGEHERAGRWWWEQAAAECGIHSRPAGGADRTE